MSRLRPSSSIRIHNVIIPSVSSHTILWPRAVLAFSTTSCWRRQRPRSRPSWRPMDTSHRERIASPLKGGGHRSAFEKMVLSKFDSIAPSTRPWRDVSQAMMPFGIYDQGRLKQEEVHFRAAMSRSFSNAYQVPSPPGRKPVASTGASSPTETTTRELDSQLFEALKLAFIRGDVKGLTAQLEYLFKSFLFRNSFSPTITAAQTKLADMRYPWEWFPATRALHRTIHLHVGPTNSGKTYHALKALEKAETGVYCGPLRLLAHEVYSRLEAKGKRCALVTGEEQRYPKDTDKYYISCTVEMAPLTKKLDVAVIDEIQMIADLDRGGAWTGAFLGVQAKEVHLCGEERVVPLIQSICATIGDRCIVHRYKRLTPLEAARTAMGGKFKSLEKGDCIVAFSRVAIHALKVNVEKSTGRRCAMIYGSLPPEVRTQQAALFNDPDNDYDFLVASDAIGMGLNLEIKRVVFESVNKHDGVDWRDLTISEIRQIGGRAGRYRTARAEMSGSNPDSSAEAGGEGKGNAGVVTTLDPRDLSLIQKTLWKEPAPIRKAAVVPPPAFLERFSRMFPPGTPLSFMILRMRELATISDRFMISIKEDSLLLADAIEDFDLSVYDRLVLITAPCSSRAVGGMDMLRAVARCVATKQGGHILDMPEMHLEVLEVDQESVPADSRTQYLHHLESLHQSVVLYLWVSYRFPSIFPSQVLAFHIRRMVQDRINAYLASLNFAEADMERRREHNRLAAKKRGLLEAEIRPHGEAQSVHDEGLGRWTEEGHEEPLAQAPEEMEELAGDEDGKSKAWRRNVSTEDQESAVWARSAWDNVKASPGGASQSAQGGNRV